VFSGPNCKFLSISNSLLSRLSTWTNEKQGTLSGKKIERDFFERHREKQLAERQRRNCNHANERFVGTLVGKARDLQHSIWE
jgi:hypothetical protein